MKRQMQSVSLEGDEVSAKRDELRRYFHQSYDLFESLFELLCDDGVFYRQSEPTRHPMIFYFGHTAVFYVNKLILAGVLKERINPRFESLFAVGVDEMIWDEESSRFAWPAVDEVREYRNRVRVVVDECIATLPMSLPVTQNDPFWAVWMGIEHERIHIETSSVLHRQMPLDYIRPSPDFPLCPDRGTAPKNAFVPMRGGPVRLGKGKEDRGLYGWDNEYGLLETEIAPFEASRYLVSNGEFLPFVEAGGYADERWWDEEGRKYRTLRNAKCPPFWVEQVDGSYRYRALAEEIEMPMNWPVEVNALEAQAFCRWKSEQENGLYRLPTEAEWGSMIRECGIEEEIFDDQNANLNLAHFASSVPVDRFEHGTICDAVGNVWQWTQTPIDGYEGFAPHPWYDDFSTPTFDTKHNLIKGGSWISTGNEIVSYSRYAFRRHFIQHAGFRYIRSSEQYAADSDTIVEDPEIAMLCEEGYNPLNTFEINALEAMKPFFTQTKSVLEIGCRAGRLSLELSGVFEEVTGIDLSARYIAPAVELMGQGELRYRTGGSVKRIDLRSLNLPHASQRVRFYQGDKNNLKPHLRGYDCIVINAVNDTVVDAGNLAESLKERLNAGGRIVILAPSSGDAAAPRFQYVRGGKSSQAIIEIRESAE